MATDITLPIPLTPPAGRYRGPLPAHPPSACVVTPPGRTTCPRCGGALSTLDETVT